MTHSNNVTTTQEHNLFEKRTYVKEHSELEEGDIRKDKKQIEQKASFTIIYVAEVDFQPY